jgi:hypothetical protein
MRMLTFFVVVATFAGAVSHAQQLGCHATFGKGTSHLNVSLGVHGFCQGSLSPRLDGLISIGYDMYVRNDQWIQWDSSQVHSTEAVMLLMLGGGLHYKLAQIDDEVHFIPGIRLSIGWFAIKAEAPLLVQLNRIGKSRLGLYSGIVPSCILSGLVGGHPGFGLAAQVGVFFHLAKNAKQLSAFRVAK